MCEALRQLEGTRGRGASGRERHERRELVELVELDELGYQQVGSARGAILANWTPFSEYFAHFPFSFFEF